MLLKNTFAALFLLICPYSFSQNSLNATLINKLDSLKKVDQFWRNELVKQINGEITTDSLNAEQIIEKSNHIDSSNYLVLSEIVDKFGFPGYDLVGEQGTGSFWLLVQHQDNHPDFQFLVLEMMEKELKKNNASKVNYAYLLDRVKVNNHQEQIYGTQMELNEEETSYQPKKCTQPEMLNQRRYEMGLPPIEDYIKMMNERFKGNLKIK